jgi:hypothetical protein
MWFISRLLHLPSHSPAEVTESSIKPALSAIKLEKDNDKNSTKAAWHSSLGGDVLQTGPSRQRAFRSCLIMEVEEVRDGRSATKYVSALTGRRGWWWVFSPLGAGHG